MRGKKRWEEDGRLREGGGIGKRGRERRPRKGREGNMWRISVVKGLMLRKCWDWTRGIEDKRRKREVGEGCKIERWKETKWFNKIC